jgi:hypothetical protein
VRIGVSNYNLSNLTVGVAQTKDFFKQEGIDAEILPVSHVEELVRSIVKALRAFQMYLPNNPMYQRAELQLRDSFPPVWAVLDEITLFVRETANINIGLCRERMIRRRWTIFASWMGSLLGIVLCIGGGVTASNRAAGDEAVAALWISGLVLCLGSMIAGVVLSRIVTATRITAPLMNICQKAEMPTSGRLLRMISYCSTGVSSSFSRYARTTGWQPSACTAIILGRRLPIQPSFSISSKAFHIPIIPTPPPVG